VCGAGLAPGLHRLVGKYAGGGGGNDEVTLSRIEMEESGVIVTPPATASGSESGEEEGVVNGEVVRRGVERGRVVEAARTGIYGLSFFMAVVGLWGDGA
jgi:hypothetical protein